MSAPEPDRNAPTPESGPVRQAPAQPAADAGTDGARAALPALAWGALGGLVCSWMASIEPNLVEEGLALHFAQRVVAGEHLYRDMVFFSGPLPFELLGVLFRVFGQEISVARGAVAVLHAVSTGLGFALARRCGTGVWAHLMAALLASAPVWLFAMLSMFFHTTLAFHLVLFAVYAALRGTRSAGWAIGAGALVSCVALCKQSIGVVLGAGLLVTLFACAPRPHRAWRSGAMVLGGLAVAALTLGTYALRGDLGHLVEGMVVLPLALGESFASPYPNLWPLGVVADALRPMQLLYLPNVYTLGLRFLADPSWGAVLVTQVLYALPWLALLGTLARRALGPLPPGVWIQAAALLALSTNLFPRADWGHLVFALPPALTQLVLLAAGRCRPVRRPAWIGTLVVATLVSLLGATGLVGLSVHALAIPETLGPRIPQRPVSALVAGPGLRRVIQYLRQRVEPGDPIFVARSEPLVYFATETTNPTPYPGVLPGFAQEQESRIVAALPEVPYVVMSDIDQPTYTYYSEELPEVQSHLERYYHIPPDFEIDFFSWIVVLERGVDRGSTAVDLLQARPAARAWVRGENGIERPLDLPGTRLVTRLNRRPLAIFMGPRGGGIDFELEVPPGAVFQGDVGLEGVWSERELHQHPRWTRIVVSVGRDGSFERLRSAKVGFGPKFPSGWVPMEADLSRFAGSRVTLRLEAIPRSPVAPGTLSWIGSPRIATRPVAPGPPAP